MNSYKNFFCKVKYCIKHDLSGSCMDIVTFTYKSVLSYEVTSKNLVHSLGCCSSESYFFQLNGWSDDHFEILDSLNPSRGNTYSLRSTIYDIFII
jgi:hypothetical protein